MAFTRFDAALRGELSAFLKKEKLAGARAWTKAIRDTALAAKARWRASLRRNGLGGFEKAVRDRHFPARGVSLRAASEVFSKAIYKRAGGSFDMLEAYEQGATIAPRQFGFLWIAREDVPRRPARGGSTRKAQPSDYPAGFLRIFRVPGETYALAVEARTGRLLFLGIPEARVTPRPLALQDESAAAAADIDVRAVANWDAETQRAGIASGVAA